MIHSVGKYSNVRKAFQTSGSGSATGPSLQARRSPTLFIPTVTGARNRIRLAEWYWKEIKEGGFLNQYLVDEKRRTPQMIRRVAQVMDGFQQNNRSDFRRLAAIPARLYQRWKAEDPDFFSDDNNLRSLKRDNPDLPVYVGPLRVKGTRTVYSTNNPKSKPLCKPSAN